MESLLEQGGPIVAGILAFAYAYRIVASVHQGRATDRPPANRLPEAADPREVEVEDGDAPKPDDGRLVQFGYRVWLFRGRRRR